MRCIHHDAQAQFCPGILEDAYCFWCPLVSAVAVILFEIIVVCVVVPQMYFFGKNTSTLYSSDSNAMGVVDDERGDVEKGSDRPITTC